LFRILLFAVALGATSVAFAQAYRGLGTAGDRKIVKHSGAKLD
jgi:hypothetical protein